MRTNHLTSSLRSLLLLDAATCAVFGTVLVAGAGWLEQLTRLPYWLLFYAGIALFPCAIVMALTAARAAIPPAAARTIVLGNVLWVLGSLLLLATGWIDPNAMGTAFVVMQAGAVVLLTVLETRAMRSLPTLQP